MNAKRQVAWWCLAAVSTIVSLSGIGWMGYDWFVKARDNHPEPTAQKLLDCTNSVLSMQFKMPETKQFCLVLGLHQDKASSFSYDAKPTREFVGKVEIRQAGTNVVSFPVEYFSAQSCNWLSRHGVPEAYILNWSDQKPWLPDKLRVGVTYELRFEFTENTPTNASLWVSLLQRHVDAKRQGSIVVASNEQ